MSEAMFPMVYAIAMDYLPIQASAVPCERSVEGMISDVFSHDPDRQLDATMKFQKLLSKERNPPIEKVIECGVVPHFFSNSFGLFEATWVLTNIASGTAEHTQVVISAGAVPEFINLLSSPVLDVREQAVWALRNIMGDSPQCRNHKLSMLRNAMWTLSNFCREQNPQPDWELISPALTVLTKLIYSLDDEILIDTCWAISYLSDAVIESAVCRCLVDLLMHSSTSVQTPALHSIGNIVTGDDLQTQVVIASGALPALLSLLSSPKEGIRKEACWTISNITTGSPPQIQAHGIYTLNMSRTAGALINILSNADFKTRKEASFWSLASLGFPEACSSSLKLSPTNHPSPHHQLSLPPDNHVLCFDFLYYVSAHHTWEWELDYSPAWRFVGQHMQWTAQMERIADMHARRTMEIYKKVFNIMDKYFPDQEEGSPSAVLDASEFFIFERW
ncbi:ARM repeat-containing protein [Suillus subluteus]|nr:ARM repeat-containing protein [Suillus subluteus]